MQTSLLEADNNVPASAALAVSRSKEPTIITAEFTEVNSKKGWLGSVVLWNDKRRLENELKVLAKAVYGHEAAGLIPGHEIYVNLNNAIEHRVTEFCTKHRIPREPIEAQIPVVSKARELALPPKPLAKIKKGLSYWAIACIALAGLGFATGLFAVGYHWCLHLFGLA